MTTESIIALLDDLAVRFGVAVDWASSDALTMVKTLIERYALYMVFESVSKLILDFILLWVCYVMAKAIKKYCDQAQCEIMDSFALYMGCIIGSCVLLAVTGMFIYDAVVMLSTVNKVIFMPELLLLDLLQG